MNILKKVFCRTYQGAFKAAIPILPYTNPQVLNSVLEIPDVLINKGINNVFIVTDEFLHSAGLLDSMKNALSEKNIKFSIYDKVQPNPTVSNVEEALSAYKESGAKALIGFGGGSSIDCAKAVGARVARAKKPISKMEGILKIILPLPFLIAVPTTAGTGSEVTVTTVITDDKSQHKFPISDFCLIPKVAVHDAKLTKTLPPHITATTGMDALVHAVEAYIGRSAVKKSKEDALKAAKLVSENLLEAYKNPGNEQARGNMLKAAFLAGRAFSKSYVGYCHAVAHSLGGKYKTPHGLANAVILPYVLECYGKSVYKRLKEMAVVMGICGADVPEEAAASAFISKLREMNCEMGIPEKISGIKEGDIPDLSAYAAKEANPLYPVPVLMDRYELEKIYYKIMEG